MSAAHDMSLVERLDARPRLADYGDTDLGQAGEEPSWHVWRMRRHGRVPRDFLVKHASWGAYEVEQFVEERERHVELNPMRVPTEAP